ncbi:37S ribosomal protein S18, mitochondrial [Acrodontium crateriforme]|uniref:Small ribosomal subunit protein uS11m n=1 Tax=Acrodontium crateriforme TaxID=150365 RepID=A0AAQ3R8M4_9PEZI|nr:37S ribosomal protein S18, mitochondrial [Acrodontium crateriforme]
MAATFGGPQRILAFLLEARQRQQRVPPTPPLYIINPATAFTMATLKTPRAFSSFVCQSCRLRLLPQHRTFASSPLLRAEDNATPPPSTPASNAPSGLGALGNNMALPPRPKSQSAIRNALDGDMNSFINSAMAENYNAHTNVKPHRMHVYATKHNTHITFVQPPRPASQTVSSGISGTSSKASDQSKVVDVLLSFSAGNIGFRKAGRGSYDAAYQLAAFVLKQIQERGLLRDIQQLEVVLRGFGAGREAVTKAILGSEGRHLRGKITAVMDATRLKLGGPRAPKPRRLG